jgi:predicted nucleic acid-binding protein
MLHRRRVYVDTSVIGGCHDPEFARESRALIEMARRGELTLLLSDLLFQELADAPAEVVAVLSDIPPEAYRLVSTTTEAEVLRQRYMAAGILAPAYEDDALHVAIATVSQADLILSWNFKHLLHVEKIRRFNAVNLSEGYAEIDIRSPKEVVPDDQ